MPNSKPVAKSKPPGSAKTRPESVGAFLLLVFLLATGCSADGGPGSPSPEKLPGTTDASPEATVPPEEPRDLLVEQISSGDPGQGPESPQVLLAPSATALSGAIDDAVPPDSGDGTYLAVYWGTKPTGGYSLAVESARLEGDRVTVRLALKEPPPDVILTQALTYPYAVAVVRDLDPLGKDFSFVDKDGQDLGWPIGRVGV